ncbi:hypothetical protein HOS79_gp016 [Lactobacillus phage Nyseid]|uniref:Uncharacterized protein n=1 Tax=Lactobacillus phage Nyseid TaxID=2079432 RepID=A0A2K9VC62_9CAUD|nr:hypothetical protein HOS79_gp016 [Lactobacillus phage Nyseid]AUV59776.1 hypothetical protein [Lactobacillus phage Nyseid]
MMKVKTFWTNCTNDYEFDDKVNSFIKDRNVIQISTGDTVLPYDDHSHTLTVLYTEESK